MTCPRCQKDPRPEHFGQPRQCGFDEKGAFLKGNWACLTLLELRYREDDERLTYSEDQRVKVLPFDGDFLILGWYKDRGNTELALVVSGYHTHPLTLSLAEAYLAGNKSAFFEILNPEAEDAG